MQTPSPSYVFGARDPLPVRSHLPGKIRLRLRNDEFGMATVRDQGSIRRFALLDHGDHWTTDPRTEQGGNYQIS